jgi:hypothetical protein
MRRKEHRDGLKHCVRCNQWLSLGSFHARKVTWDGLHAYCAFCMSASAKKRYEQQKEKLLAQSAAWRRANPEKRKAIALRTKFGLEMEAYQRMLATQDGKCAICLRPANLDVDHCHTLGVVRGLLCRPCNTAIGSLGDDPDRMRAAAAYVEAHR